MAKTIKEAFRQYASNLEITDRQESIVANCRANVVRKLKQEIALHDEQAKVIGSWDRNTLIRYLSEGDVDVMVVLHYGKNAHWNSPHGTRKVLERFYSILKASYSNTPMRIDDNCVTMKLSQFKLDVVPAFKWNGGYYTIPDTSRGTWIKTDPFLFAELITDTNIMMDDTFVPLIKMVKGWNREHDNIIKGFHLECILYNHYKDYTQAYTYDSTLKVFFQALPGYLLKPTYDPATGDRVDAYLDVSGKRLIAVIAAQMAAKDSLEAYNDREYPSLAIEEWEDLLGEFFPTYG